jgi:hypothetical protein
MVGELRRGRRTDAPLCHKEGRKKRDDTGGGETAGRQRAVEMQRRRREVEGETNE